MKGKVTAMSGRSFVLLTLGAFAFCAVAGAAGESAVAVKAPEGFVPLFNGKDLTGWKGLVDDPESRRR